jgi:hypothetical protein
MLISAMWAAEFAVLPVTVILTYLAVVWLNVSVTMLFPVLEGTIVFQFEPSVEA